MPSGFVDPRAVDDGDAPPETATPTPRRSSVADGLFYGLSSAADHGLLWLAVGSWRAARRGDPAIAARLAAALSVESVLTNVVVKSFFRRIRPPDLYVQRGPLPYGMRRPITSSFPSGHATSAFMAATLLAQGGRHPVRSTAKFFSLATLVAWSRVHVKLHHVGDVVAGAVLGLALGQLARKILPLQRR